MPARPSPTSLTVAILATAALVSCSGDGGDEGAADGGATATTVAATPPVVTASDTTIVATAADGSLFPVGDVDAGLAPWVELATAQLATSLDVDVAAISTVSAVLVVWPDASLGCPQPDQQYAAALTDGAVIELSSGDDIYRFHAGGERGPFLCERPITSAPPRG